MDYELSKVITWYEKRKDLFDTIKEIGDDMELENNDDKFNIEKQIPLMAWHMSKTPPA